MGVMRQRFISVFALLTVACGPVMGDPCSANSQCGPGVCLQRDFTPGGYCSQTCGTCPTGSVCVADALGKDTPGCMKTCGKESDCREGYLCRVEHGSQVAICVGPAGI